jgi:hypothetical protein
MPFRSGGASRAAANGPFWEGIVELLVATPALDGHFWTDSEASALLAHSSERAVLDDLVTRLSAIANDEKRLRALMELAHSRGFGFDD